MQFNYEVETFAYYAARLLGVFNNGKIIGENTFITFNYDTLLEDGMHTLGISFSYGLKPDKINFSENAKASSEDQAIKILKLHGSVNWRLGAQKGNFLEKVNCFWKLRTL